MQTFLPLPSFIDSIRALDRVRAWKQVVEAKQIVCTLRAAGLPSSFTDSKSYQNQSWKRHPAVQMWRGYEEAMKAYYNASLEVALKNGVRTTLPTLDVVSNPGMPWWLGDEAFHRAMRARLILKDESFYLPKFPDDKGFNDSMYLWPENASRTFRLI